MPPTWDTELPARHEPGFEVDSGARVVTPNELVELADPAEGFTILGAGKTAMDICTWLLGQSVAPEDIRWVRPRDAWTLDRTFTQPLDLVAGMIQGLADAYEAAAEASDLEDLYARAEACGQIHRLDPEVEPDMFHGATLSAAEREQLRRITQVIRKGRVRRVGVDALVLDEGTVPTDARGAPRRLHRARAGLGATTPDLRGGPDHPAAHAHGDAAVQRGTDRFPGDQRARRQGEEPAFPPEPDPAHAQPSGLGMVDLSRCRQRGGLGSGGGHPGMAAAVASEHRAGRA